MSAGLHACSEGASATANPHTNVSRGGLQMRQTGIGEVYQVKCVESDSYLTLKWRNSKSLRAHARRRRTTTGRHHVARLSQGTRKGETMTKKSANQQTVQAILPGTRNQVHKGICRPDTIAHAQLGIEAVWAFRTLGH